LASESPRRVEILNSLGMSFTSEGVDIDETRLGDEPASAMVLRLAEAKARAAAARYSGLILGSDTVVALGDRILGKPGSKKEALDMLSSLSGHSHEVFTAVVLLKREQVFSDISVTSVRFREIHSDEARQYWQSGEPRGKAGAYAIQGLGGLFVESIDGSYSGVVGLPVFHTAKLLARAGMPVLKANQQEETRSK